MWYKIMWFSQVPLEFTIYILVYVVLFQRKLTTKKIRYVLSVFIVIVAEYLFWRKFKGEGAIVLCMVTLIVIPILLIDGKKIESIFLYPVVVVGSSIVTIGSGFFISMIKDITKDEVQGKIGYLLTCYIVPIVILIIIWIFRKNKGKIEQLEITLFQYVLLYIGCICSFFMLSIIQIASDESLNNKEIGALGFALSLFSISFIGLNFWQSVIQRRTLYYKNKNEQYEEYMRYQEERVKEIVEQDESMRRFRHDMNAHIAALNAYCDETDSSKMREYLDNVISESKIFDNMEYTGNKALDAVIRQQLIVAENKNISVQINGSLNIPKHIQIFDLCTIVSNLMKNAIEASERIDIRKRYIQVDFAGYCEQITIKVTNNVLKPVEIQGDVLVTSKDDKKNHGLGSENVKRTVEKYDGDINYTNNNGKFIAEIFL